MKKYTILFTPLLLIILISCQQEISDIITQAQQCRIETGLYYGGSGGINDSATFVYDANGRLVKWADMDGTYDYFYNGNNITNRRYMENGALIYEDSIKYDGSNRVLEIHMYDYSGMWTDTAHGKFIFEYQNNRVSRLVNIEYWDTPLGVQTDTFSTNIYWNAAGNIEKMVMVDISGTPYDSIQFQYDSHPNYFKVIHPHFFLFDPNFQLHAGFEPHLAYFYSTNNVTNSNMYGTWDSQIEYGLDSLNKVTSLKMGGFDYMHYKYKCP